MPVPVRIQTKFLVLVLGILAAVLGTLSCVIMQREAALLDRKNAEQEHLLARTVVADLAESMLTGRPRSTLKLIGELEGTQGLIRIEVLRSDGTHAFDLDRPRRSGPQLEEVFRTGRALDYSEDRGRLQHTNLFPLRNEPACRRCHPRAGDLLGVVLISHSREEIRDETRASRRQLGLLLIATLGVMGLALFLAVRTAVLGPLRTLHQGAQLIGAGDLGHRIAIFGRDEFHDLAEAFNEMADRLKQTHAGLENRVKIRTAELNESVRLMRGILSSMSSGIVLLARDGTVKLVNRQGAWLLGHSIDDLLGRKLSDVVPEADAFLTLRVGSYEEIVVPGPEGIKVPVGFTSSYYAGTEGEQEGLIVVFQDLTELKELQTELVSRERFAAMGRVVAGVAHEIRNPLFGISAIGQIFERDLADPGQKELARALVGETKRLNQLVEDLLIYGRPMKLKLERIDVRALWNEVLEMHGDELRRRDIRVVDDHTNLRHSAIADAYQVRQVLLNLLRNAIEATPDSGSIRISFLLNDRFLLWRIKDSGTGIPADQLEHVFDPFFTTKPKGTGLGLSICRKIVRDHGGDITIESEPEKGTTVTISLPSRQTAPAGEA